MTRSFPSVDQHLKGKMANLLVVIGIIFVIKLRISDVQSKIALENDMDFYKNVNVNKWVNATVVPPEGLAFASYFGDHMVLQRGPQKATVWGYAAIADLGKTLKVMLTSDDKSYSNSFAAIVRKGPVGNQAVWAVQLAAMTHPGPYTVAATLGTQSIKMVDVMFGDVWLCSGQSNMQFTVSMMLRAKEEIANAVNYPLIRLFTVGMVASKVPLYDLSKVEEKWSVASSATVGGSPWAYFSAVCWMFGKDIHTSRGYPIGLVGTNWGGTQVEDWCGPDCLSACGLASTGEIRPGYSLTGPAGPSILWNAMIHPLLNMTIYGAIWYQGEANTIYNRDLYNCTFPQMIQDWRSKFNMASLGQTSPKFPFGFVQLAANKYPSVHTSTGEGFPEIRWHQTADTGYVPNYKMPNVFMAVAIDLPDFNGTYGCIHPRDKTTVGRRLALAGLAVAYGAPNIRYQGPQISAYYIDIGFYTLGLSLDGADHPISVRGRDGFEVCCSTDNQTYCPNGDAKWVAVPVMSWTTSSVTLDYKACARHYVVGVRYLWAESPCLVSKMCPVYSMENDLPMAPFITLGLIGDGKTHTVEHGHQITLD